MPNINILKKTQILSFLVYYMILLCSPATPGAISLGGKKLLIKLISKTLLASR